MENAVKYYNIVLNVDENNARAHNNIGYAYSHMGMHDKAISHYQKSVDLNPSANAYDSLADGYSTAGFTEKAIKAKEKGIELDPSLFYLHG
nr:tetratricopeptide repeat protein [Pseudemcibacter aquimaris]